MRSVPVVLHSWHLTLIIIASTSRLCSALDFTLQPWETDRPVPGTVMFFNVTRSSGDPQLVDVTLADTQRGNSTVLFVKHDLSQYPYAGFELPAGLPAGSGYVVRISDATTTPSIPLKDSPTFQVYPPGTRPSVTQTSSSMSGTVLSITQNPSSTTTSSSDNTETSTKSALPVGAIAGGVVGGVVLIALFIGLLWCIRRQDRPFTAEELERKRQKKLKEKPLISPFTLTEPPPPPPDPSSYPPPPSDSSSSPIAVAYPSPRRQRSNGATQDSARAEKARLAQTMQNRDREDRGLFSDGAIERLPTELTASSTIGGTSSDLTCNSSTTLLADAPTPPGKSPRKKGSKPRRIHKAVSGLSDAERAEALRKEREKLDKQIAELERRASVGGSRSASRRRQTTEDDEMLAQLAALREQMQLIDQGRASVPQEPPPEYYPASVAASRR